MPEGGKIISKLSADIKKRGIKSLFNEIKDNYFLIFSQCRNPDERRKIKQIFSPLCTNLLFCSQRGTLSTFRNYEKLNFIDVGCGKGKVY